MKKGVAHLLIILSFYVSCLILGGCRSSSVIHVPNSELRTFGRILDKGVTVIVGDDHSYIPICFKGEPRNYAEITSALTAGDVSASRTSERAAVT